MEVPGAAEGRHHVTGAAASAETKARMLHGVLKADIAKEKMQKRQDMLARLKLTKYAGVGMGASGVQPADASDNGDAASVASSVPLLLASQQANRRSSMEEAKAVVEARRAAAAASGGENTRPGSGRVATATPAPDMDHRVHDHSTTDHRGVTEV